MADRTPIEWTDATINAINGCTLVSEGCRNCYAARLAATRMRAHPTRAGLARITADGTAKFTGELRLNERALLQPLDWNKPRRIFWNAHGDTFHEGVPDGWVDRMFAVMALTPHHTHQVLTKRPERMRNYVEAHWARVMSEVCDMALELRPNVVLIANPKHVDAAPRGRQVHLWRWPLPQVWIGVSIEDQATADARIPALLSTPAAVRFVSAEPLLGPLDLTTIPRTRELGHMRPLHGRFNRLDWVIAGGESGPKARPSNPQWFRDLRDQCKAADVPFLFKQWGEWVSVSEVEGGGPHFKFPNGRTVRRVGKARAGRTLDGLLHDGMPKEDARANR